MLFSEPLNVQDRWHKRMSDHVRCFTNDPLIDRRQLIQVCITGYSHAWCTPRNKDTPLYSYTLLLLVHYFIMEAYIGNVTDLFRCVRCEMDYWLLCEHCGNSFKQLTCFGCGWCRIHFTPPLSASLQILLRIFPRMFMSVKAEIIKGSQRNHRLDIVMTDCQLLKLETWSGKVP